MTFHLKSEILKKIDLRSLNYSYHVDLLIYGLAIRFYSTDKIFIQKIAEYHPPSWHKTHIKPDYHFYFEDAYRYSDAQFFEDDNPEFHVFKTGNQRSCIQRDFIGHTIDDEHFYFLTQLDINDGYFNCLRWVLPSLLIHVHSMVIHSSCVAIENHGAYLFLGQSGAGKTTTIKTLSEHTILGDDMNILSFSDGKWFVQAGAIGGQIVYKKFDEKFELKKMFWLKKNSNLKLISIPSEEAQLKLLGSAANLFFGLETPEFTANVIDLLHCLATNVSMQELALMKGDALCPFIL